jgi:enamine deaminase RidA (YjgF/YER057c/UK114 family)
MKKIPVFVFVSLLSVSAIYAQAKLPKDVARFGDLRSSILSGVAVPDGRAYYITSGIVAPAADTTAPAGSRARYGDTKMQSIGILKRIETDLKAQGLSLSDVIFLRVYVAPDKLNADKPDFKGWFDAYAEFFNNVKNPVKVARSTIGVASLVTSDFLIEIEAVAVYPK